MAKKTVKTEKPETPENQLALTPNIENPELLAKLQKLAKESGISVQELVNLKIDELRNNSTISETVEPAKKETVKSEPAPQPASNVVTFTDENVTFMCDCIKTILKNVNFDESSNVRIAEYSLLILKMLQSK